MDDYEEELDRWIHRAYVRLAELPAGSQQERQLASAILGMEHDRLRRRIHRAHTELGHLPAGSDERRKLAQALNEMEDEYSLRQREIRRHAQESSKGGGRIEIAAEAREASPRASTPTAPRRASFS